jgi:L-asparagine transporter-like permease
MAAIICLYPYNKLSTDISPFVDVFQKIGIPLAAQVMNMVAITAALSAFNSCLYSSSRMLYNLATHNNAPRKLATLNKNGVPATAIITTSVFVLIAVIVNYIWPQQAIMYLLTIATGSIVITWFIILISQIFFRRYHVKTGENIEYRLQLFPYLNILAMLALFVVMMVMTKMDDKKLSIYITPLWILLLSIFFLLRKKSIKSNQERGKTSVNE